MCNKNNIYNKPKPSTPSNNNGNDYVDDAGVSHASLFGKREANKKIKEKESNNK